LKKMVYNINDKWLRLRTQPARVKGEEPVPPLLSAGLSLDGRQDNDKKKTHPKEYLAT